MSNKLYRLIDANVNRAMEGIRVVEDVARFELDQKIITSHLKNLRSDLKKAVISLGIPGYELLHARDSRKDIGADLCSDGEASRVGMDEIVTSNFKRVEESLRVLEETAKLKGPRFGKVFKGLRYKTYNLEKQIASDTLSFAAPKTKLNEKLYVIVDPEFSLGRSPEKVVLSAIKGGAKLIQLRAKKLSKARYYSCAKRIARICRKAGCAFIVNDHVDIAKAVDADGVHVGQDDIPIKEARQVLGPGKIVGASAGNLVEAGRAEREGADYIGFGPVFPTEVKKLIRPAGLKPLRQVAKKVKIPVFAIGGINRSNVVGVKGTGAKGVAVIRAVAGERNVSSAVRAFRRQLGRG